MANKAQIHSTTQQFLDIYDITNDFIILNDGAAALVITVSAMNFGLLSEEEQDATIYAYAALLNSLSFPIQIVIRSQPKDVTTYLKLIEQKENEIVNPIYKQRIREYRSFVESMVQEQNVLDKKFFITIPLTAVEMGLTTQSVVPGAKNKPISSFEKNYIIDKAKTNLIPRRDHLIDQLARIGLYSRQLTTQELIQLLYSAYNPESFEGQQVTDTQNYTTPLVQAKIQGDFSMTDQSLPTNPAPMAPAEPAVQPATPVTPVAPAEQPTPITPTAPVVETPMVSTPTPTTPAASVPQESGLGVTTPVSMSTPQANPETPAVATPVVPPAQEAFPSAVTPEQPIVTPPASVGTAPQAAETPVVAAVDDIQSTINQSLSQMGTTPVVDAGSAPMNTPVVPEV